MLRCRLPEVCVQTSEILLDIPAASHEMLQNRPGLQACCVQWVCCIQQVAFWHAGVGERLRCMVCQRRLTFT